MCSVEPVADDLVSHHAGMPVLASNLRVGGPAILNAMSDQPQPEYLQPAVRADGPIRLVDPDPEWAAQYARQEERIRRALGPRVVRVEHIGSTAVPGLAAKPVIDIVLTVADSSDEAGYLPDLCAAGYVLQFQSPTGTSIVSCAITTRTYRCTCSPMEVRRWSGCCFSAIGCAADPRSVSCMNAPSVSLLPDAGRTSRTTPTPSRPSLKRSSPEPELDRVARRCGVEPGLLLPPTGELALRMADVTARQSATCLPWQS